MKTYSFIGSDKNAGKTTAFKAVYQQMHNDPARRPLCITSIGINGEEADSYEGGSKPTIRLFRDTFFISSGEQLHRHTGKYETLATFQEPHFSRDYILGKCLTGFAVVLEGPNSGQEILRLKEDLRQRLPAETILLIDGSIDRQFLARPEISDGFFFAVLFSSRAPQQQKTRNFLSALSIAPCPEATAHLIRQHKNEATKSLLMDAQGTLRYRGEVMPYSDKDLLQACEAAHDQHGILYLDGAFTSSLHEALACYQNLDVVLDNFSQYLNISTGPAKTILFRPGLFLLNPVRIQAMYLKQETDFAPGLLPGHTRAINLFRTDHHEIGI